MNLRQFYDKEAEAMRFIASYNHKIVNYRLFDKINNKSYIGSAVDLYVRIFGSKFGHVGSLFRNVRHDYIHLKILEVGLENFELIIERDDFKTIEEAEENEKLLIEKYDSFLNGYNLTKNGKGGYVGTVQLISPDKKSTIRVKPNEVDEYLLKGYIKGSNRRVVTDPSTGKFFRVNVEEAEELVNKKGWIYGSKLLSTTNGFIAITNESFKKNKKIPKTELENYLSLGWKKGFKIY